MAGRARHRPGCNSAMPARGGCRSRATAAVASASPELLPNAETWLDFTDLVFIDPVGTGYSRFVASGEDVRRRIWSVDGDVEAIALVIRRWLEKYDRLLSPKYRRRRKLWRHSRTEGRAQPADQAGRRRARPDPGFARARFPRLGPDRASCNMSARLPTMAAVAREAKGPVTHADLADVERYARGEFLVDLVKGQADAEATNADGRQGRGADRHRCGGDPQACRAFQRRRIPPRVRPQQRQGHRPLRRVGDRLRSLSRFELLAVRRSLRRSADGAADQRRRRSHHAQAELAAGRFLPTAQRRRRQCLGFRPRPQPAESVSAAADPRARSEAEATGRARAVRSRHAVFRLRGSRSTSCRPMPRPTASSSRSIPAGTCSIRARVPARRSAARYRR